MSMLKSVTRGKIEAPEFLVLYGPDGIGKSTFAAMAPKTIFLGAESGTDNLDVSRFPTPKSFTDCQSAVLDLVKEKHEFQTLAIDTMDWIEPLMFRQLCERDGVTAVEDSCGGYGKWTNVYATMWRDYMDLLKTLRETKKMNIILLAHAQVKAFQDPKTSSTYDRYVLKIHDKAAAIVREAAQNVLFANFEVHTKEDKGAKKAKAFGDGTRKLYCERRPAYDAKNRDGLPSELNFSWQDYIAAKAAAGQPATSDLVTQIVELTAQIPDENTKKKIMESVEKAKDNAANLNVILNRIRTLLSA